MRERRPSGARQLIRADGCRSSSPPTTGDLRSRRLLSPQIEELPMAYAGQIITNPVSGERIEFIATAKDTNGERLEFELALPPDGHVPGAHVHPEQEERFHVLEGTMRFRLGMRTIVAGPGETVVVPAGRVHRFANGGESPARARVEVTPALDMEDLLETTTELALEGNVTRKGMPKP